MGELNETWYTVKDGPRWVRASVGEGGEVYDGSYYREIYVGSALPDFIVERVTGYPRVEPLEPSRTFGFGKGFPEPVVPPQTLQERLSNGVYEPVGREKLLGLAAIVVDIHAEHLGEEAQFYSKHRAWISTEYGIKLRYQRFDENGGLYSDEVAEHIEFGPYSIDEIAVPQPDGILATTFRAEEIDAGWVAPDDVVSGALRGLQGLDLPFQVRSSIYMSGNNYVYMEKIVEDLMDEQRNAPIRWALLHVIADAGGNEYVVLQGKDGQPLPFWFEFWPALESQGALPRAQQLTGTSDGKAPSYELPRLTGGEFRDALPWDDYDRAISWVDNTSVRSVILGGSDMGANPYKLATFLTGGSSPDN